MIERYQGKYQGRNKSSAYKDLVWTVATALDTNATIEEQTRTTLKVIEDNLIEAGSDKTKILSAQVYISTMKDKPLMDQVWCEWIGEDKSNWPQRACLGVDLEGDVLIEVAVVAVRGCTANK
ncbi:MAG: RidA family protein [Pseudomonadales bacterium]|nr:RidA family protein [Pseudomonadales bacterium]